MRQIFKQIVISRYNEVSRAAKNFIISGILLWATTQENVSSTWALIAVQLRGIKTQRIQENKTLFTCKKGSELYMFHVLSGCEKPQLQLDQGVTVVQTPCRLQREWGGESHSHFYREGGGVTESYESSAVESAGNPTAPSEVVFLELKKQFTAHSGYTAQ